MGGEKNSVVARLLVSSTGDQRKKLSFGYSDEVLVFVNGVPLYGGSNRYPSRDYRYLGTIGLFDEVYLPLRNGHNAVRFVVTEAFGGWGIQARFEDPQGIAF